MTESSHDVTRLLELMQQGDDAARERLFELVYPQLKRLAASRMRGERVDHLLQPTALVHEAFLRIAGVDVQWRNRGQFFGLTAEIMRHVLVDAARQRQAVKRGGGAPALDAAALDVSAYDQPDLVLDIDRLLTRLHTLDRRQARVVELRYFGGLTEPEIATALDVSERTVKRDWQMARAWMRKELTRQ